MYVGAAGLGMGFADRLIFVPPPPSYGGDLDGLVRLESAEGDTIAARFVEAPGSQVVILFAHGNAEDMGHGRVHAAGYADLGASILTFDYPGYGLSSGRPSEEGAYAAVDAAYEHLTQERGFPPEAIIAHGRSLGGGVVVDLASRRRVGGLVMESSFVSAYRGGPVRESEQARLRRRARARHPRRSGSGGGALARPASVRGRPGAAP
jgi:alpha-beta hydrolase superfamily lysophospholipase